MRLIWILTALDIRPIIRLQCICIRLIGTLDTGRRFPVAEMNAAQEVSLPIYYGMSDEQIGYVIDVVNRFKKNVVCTWNCNCRSLFLIMSLQEEKC